MSSALDFHQFDKYIDHIWEHFCLTVPSNGQEFLHISDRCKEKATKIFSKYGQYIYQIAGNLVLSTNSVLK